MRKTMKMNPRRRMPNYQLQPNTKIKLIRTRKNKHEPYYYGNNKLLSQAKRKSINIIRICANLVSFHQIIRRQRCLPRFYNTTGPMKTIIKYYAMYEE